MSHMVIYRGTDGKPGYHQTDDIHDAVGFVEQLRNDRGVEQARIFRLEEVNFEYRPYYRVELKAGSSLNAGTSSKPAVAASTSTPDVAASNSKPAVEAAASDASEEVESAAPVITASADEEISENGVGARRGLFGR